MKNILLTIVLFLSAVAGQAQSSPEAKKDVADIRKLYAEAKQKFGDMTNDELEEHMAEDFREYTMSQDKRGLGRKMLDFFRNLFDKVTNWKYMRPTLDNYYRAVNAGRYVKSEMNIEPLAKKDKSSTWATIEDSDRETLTKRGWTEQQFNSVSQEERDQALRCMHF